MIYLKVIRCQSCRAIMARHSNIWVTCFHIQRYTEFARVPWFLRSYTPFCFVPLILEFVFTWCRTIPLIFPLRTINSSLVFKLAVFTHFNHRDLLSFRYRSIFSRMAVWI
jgi:hypothetical protein